MAAGEVSRPSSRGRWRERGLCCTVRVSVLQHIVKQLFIDFDGDEQRHFLITKRSPPPVTLNLERLDGDDVLLVALDKDRRPLGTFVARLSPSPLLLLPYKDTLSKEMVSCFHQMGMGELLAEGPVTELGTDGSASDDGHVWVFQYMNGTTPKVRTRPLSTMKGPVRAHPKWGQRGSLWISRWDTGERFLEVDVASLPPWLNPSAASRMALGSC